MAYGTVNVPGGITAEELNGKADADHKHTKSDITDFPASMTPASHAASSTVYGAGDSSNYGHVKLSDSTSSSSSTTGGTAATPAAVKAAYDLANGKANASHNHADAYAKKSIYDDTYVSLGRKANTTVGNKSFAFGYNVQAIREYSHAEGYETMADGSYGAHAEGRSTTVTGGSGSHAEGYNTTASGSYASHSEGYGTTSGGGYGSHSEGRDTTAEGQSSHSEGYKTTAASIGSHAEGYNTTAKGGYSHAEGDNTTAEGQSSHAEGYQTTASGSRSHAEGVSTTAEGSSSHAEGSGATAEGDCSHAEGYSTTASNYASHVSGKYNKAMTIGGSNSNIQKGDVFVVGNGTSDSNLSNAMRVTYEGDVLSLKACQSGGADYAEFIKPWYDDNPDNEDRVGYFVTIKDGLLYKADEGDYIVGITSGNPSVVGNADEDYYWKYERDEFNRIVMEDVPELVQAADENGNPLYDEDTGRPVMKETGNIIPNARMKLAKNYDSALQEGYVERKYRKEWDYVGMIGVLPVRDDGTCVAGQFCKCGKDGIATYADARGFDTYMVIERINDNVVSVVLK